MTNEIALIMALKNKNIPAVREIVDPEIENIKKGLTRTIDTAYVDEFGKSFAHYATIWGDKTILWDIVLHLRCKTDIADQDSHQPIYYDRGAKLRKLLGEKGVEINREEMSYLAYRSRVENILHQEEKDSAYQPGIVFSKNFKFFWSSKPNKPAKKCEISTKINDTELDIHDTQSITEAFIASKAKTSEALPGVPNKLSGNNYVVANIGCIISDTKHESNGPHKRIFISTPIYTAGLSYTLGIQAYGGHGESFFIYHLMQEEVLKSLLIDLFSRNNISLTDAGSMPRKVYSIIIDLHTSQDMCEIICEPAVHKFQTDAIDIIRKALRSLGFKLPEKNTNNFKILFRVSSSREPSHSGFRGTPIDRLTNVSKYPHLSRTHTHEEIMDLKRTTMPLIIHSDSITNQAKWYDSANYPSSKFAIPKYTVFDAKGHMFSSDLYCSNAGSDREQQLPEDSDSINNMAKPPAPNESDKKRKLPFDSIDTSKVEPAGKTQKVDSSSAKDQLSIDSISASSQRRNCH